MKKTTQTWSEQDLGPHADKPLLPNKLMSEFKFNN